MVIIPPLIFSKLSIEDVTIKFLNMKLSPYMVGVPALFVSHQGRRYISPGLFILLALHKDGIIKQL